MDKLCSLERFAWGYARRVHSDGQTQLAPSRSPGLDSGTLNGVGRFPAIGMFSACLEGQRSASDPAIVCTGQEPALSMSWKLAGYARWTMTLVLFEMCVPGGTLVMLALLLAGRVSSVTVRRLVTLVPFASRHGRLRTDSVSIADLPSRNESGTHSSRHSGPNPIMFCPFRAGVPSPRGQQPRWWT